MPFLLGGDVREFYIDTTKTKRCLADVSNGLLRKSRLAAGDLGRVGGVVTEPLPPQSRACAIDALGSSPDRFAQEALP